MRRLLKEWLDTWSCVLITSAVQQEPRQRSAHSAASSTSESQPSHGAARDAGPRTGKAETGASSALPRVVVVVDNRLKQRQKQIAAGKSTAEYRNYRRLVPTHQRDPCAKRHPRTPDPGGIAPSAAWTV